MNALITGGAGFIGANAARRYGWSPKISRDQGLSLLYDWVAANRELFK